MHTAVHPTAAESHAGAAKAIRVAVAGATGFTGQELLRILSRHPLVTLTAATGYKAIKDGRVMLDTYSLGSVTVGFVAAAIAAAVAVAWMLHYLRRRGLAVFGYYRIALAVAVAALLWGGKLAP